MSLVTECNVSLNKVNSVISTVLHKLSGVLPDRLPSMAVKSRLLIEAKAVAQQQIVDATPDNLCKTVLMTELTLFKLTIHSVTRDIIHSPISFEYFPFSNVTI
jgi:hypothetical protein